MLFKLTLLKRKILIGVAVLTVAISAFVVYAAYVDRTMYKTETLVIIPDSVTSDSWSGLNSVLVQDISEYSLYQDFTTENSAYISELGLFSRHKADVDAAASETTTEEEGTQGGSSDTENDAASPVESTTPEPHVDAPTEAESAPDTATPPEPAPEPTPAEPVSVMPTTPIEWSVLPRAMRYPLAQAIIDEPTPSTENSEPAPEVDAQTQSESVISPVEPDTADSPSSAPASDEVSSSSVPEGVGETTDSSTTESVSGSVPVDEVAADQNDFKLASCDSAKNCESHSMLFKGFVLPDFESGTLLDSVQLRLSLAAQLKRNHGDGPQRFVIEYTYDTATVTPKWNTASVIDVEDEISNSINGGYFLLSLDEPHSAGEVANLQVRVTYQGTIAELDRAYVEGIWLEVTAGTFYEEGDGEPYTDALTYNRDLLQPHLNTLDNGQTDPALGTLPAFTLSYDPQQNFFSRILKSIFSENTFAVDQVTLTDSEGVVVNVPIAIEYPDADTWTVRLEKQPQSLRPGKYTVTARMLENNVPYEETFEFYWGVLAVNTEKSMYAPNEPVTLNLAALTADGTTICDADLHLKIIDPKHNIFEVPVTQSGSCGPNNVTDVPDYTAQFAETGEWGAYTIQLENRNTDGQVVHKIQDSFEVRDYIPFDIVRTAPTRIYPPSPYSVHLAVTAHRDFVGDITERVPRGFALDEISGGALTSTLPEYTLITWKNVTLKEGDKLDLSYTFDAPDVSPYMYLLGPLDMDGFAELRQWQIASDALNNIGWFTGTRTVAGTNLNNSPSPFQWSTSSIDNYYYAHATSSNSNEITLRQNGDYFVSVNLPMERTDANVSRTRGGIEVRVNGVAVPQGLGRSGIIHNTGAHSESSSNVSFLLTDVHANDILEVFEENLDTVDVGDVLNVTAQASLYLEYMPSTQTVFAATTTQTTNSTNLNLATAYPMSWVETRQDSGFVHSDTVTPQNITISATGTYMVHVNIPIRGITNTVQNNIIGKVLLDGNVVTGGLFQQGYLEASTTESDGDASIHWSGVVVATTTNQVLTITAQQEAGAGTTTVTPGFVGSIFIQKLPTTGVIALTGRDLVSGTNWNPTATTSVKYDNRLTYDNAAYTHSTSTNSHQITVTASGDYFLTVNNALTGATTYTNSRISIQISSSTYRGAQTKSNLIRAQNNHSDSSASMVYLLEGLTAGQIVTVNTTQEATAATVNDNADSIVLLWKKAALDFRPAAPSMFNTPFDNARFASTTPYFDFQANDPDGSSNIQYQFSLATTSDFAASTTRTSGTDAGFSNTASSSNVSPFIEANRIRFQLQPADALSDLTTYYWRVRAKDATGSGEFGDWSTTQSFTVNGVDTTANWYQTERGQFLTNTLVGAVPNSTTNNIKVDSTVSSEILIAYGDSTSATPKFRLWGGTSWGIEQSAVAVGGTVNWVRTAAGVKRDEYILATIDQSASAYAQVYNASSSSWGNRTLMSSTVSDVTRRGIAVAYESVSGDAMVVSCSTGAKPVYRIWNGSTWSATSTINVTSANNCNFIEMASDPASDEIIVVVRDSGTTVGNNYEALVWDGSSFVASRVLGSVQATQEGRAGIGVAYESSGDQAVVAVTNGTNNNFIYTTWTGSAFTTNATQPLFNDFEFGHLTADPGSDYLTLCYINDSARVGAIRWDGGVWSTYTDLSTTGNSQAARPIDCEYETTAGRSGNILVNYSETTNLRYQLYASSSWQGQQTVTGVGAGTGVFWVQTERAGDGTIVSVAHDDAVAGDEIESTYWNGTSWSTKQSIVPNPSSIIGAPYETFEMAAKRYQFTQGTVTTAPISFSSVPNQPTWGDFTFSSTEPFGTDVTVRLKYTSTTTCDSYIPNGVLSGNATGFDSTLLPVNLTALSTSTYSQICLEATLTTFGSASASLDDWSLSWVRKPKLTQSNFRWYVNGSFLTPTDPWPLGVTDVAENTALTSAESINTNDVIRLRMSLLETNVPLPTSTAAFKIQYAPGLTCSAATGWADVGSTSSSTAVWRGYANAIIGSDWLSASWLKRQKVSVKYTMVSGAQTDFPVYVNLADLPATFFAGVKSNGADIRVTKADGLTEVPFDLVSINTTTKIGELHFKATLATSSDTDFYIYYGNAAASAYSASATYGSQNVWTNNYAGVYHMLQDPTTGAPQVLDSTANARHASRNGTAGAGMVVDAKLGKGLDFVGTAGDYTIDFPTFGIGSTGSYTYSAWFKSSTTVNGLTTDGNGTYMADRTTGTNELVGLKAVGGNYSHQYRYNDGSGLGGVTGGAISAAAWQQVVWGRSYNVNRFIAVNNVLATTTDSASLLTPPLMRLGGHQGNTGYTGLVDEVRVASAVRSTGWLTTEYNNQSNATGFFTLSSEELIGDGRTVTTTVLTASNYGETYEEQNPTASNRYGLAVGQKAEWDFVMQNNGAAADTNYCFRMVYSDGSVLNSYSNYPRLITNAPPPAPTLSAPFDNRKLASTSPYFEFTTNDEAGDLVSYEIAVDNDFDFTSPTFTRESNANFSLFTNLSSPSERGVYSSGQNMRFVPNVSLTNGVTYWWRVRAKDDTGSGAYGAWSDPKSFTISTGTVLTTWFQTTGDQFNTNSFSDGISSTSTDDFGINTSFTSATTTSTAVDYDDREVGNAWGNLSFTQNVSSGSIRHYVEYEVTSNSFALVPDADLPGNSSGFTSSPVVLSGLDTTTYNVLRVTSVLSGNATLPRLQDMTITWSQKIEPPTLLTLFDNAKSATATPALTFTTTDPQSDDLQYEVQISTAYAFTSSSTYLSGVNAGFTNTSSSSDTSPFTSAQTVQYKVQSALTNGVTYWWRARARDPGGSNSWSNYSTPHSFTIDTSTSISVWHQTIGEQFSTNDNVDIETTTGGAQVTSIVNGVMVAYGEGTGQAPQYRTWNGVSWSAAASADTVGAQIDWTRLKAAPTRPEYALATLGTDLDTNIQIYDAITESWSNIFKIYDNSVTAVKRSFDIGYETTSGRLMAVSCVGNNAVYALWNGSSWSATSTITLASGSQCEWVQLASDPTSNEMVAVFRHINTGGTPDYEAQVWSGTAWGNSTRFGDINADASEGMVVQYEESGDQVIVGVQNNTALNMLWRAWNGSTWSATSTVAMGARMLWGNLKRDVGSDRMMLCYVDNDADIGVIPWTGSAWGSFSEMTVTANDNRGLPVDCEFQTTQGTDGDVVIPYSDTTAGRYQTYQTATGSYSGEFSLDVVNNSWRFQTVRGGDGTIHMFAFDDGSAPDRYDTSRWDGTAWTARQNFSTNPSITALPFDGSITAAAQTYPNFTDGSIRSTAINFADGASPRWERVRWNDTTPSLSDIKYRVYYESSPAVFSLVPDAALAGNSAGFTNSPIDISSLDRTVYTTLKLDAELICDSGICPSIQDWSVEWSQGITVSGSALEYDQTTLVASGTVAVAVNGVLQVGKTANIAAGTTTQQVVFSTAGTSTFSVPSGVTNVTVKVWGAGGGAGAGGTSDAGGAGGGAGFAQANITTIPAENLSIFVGGGGIGGTKGLPAGAGGGGGYSAIMRSSTPLVVAGSGGGGGAGAGGVSYVGVGTECAVSATTCTPTIPGSTRVNDVYVAVLHSRTNTAHTCTLNCTGWTEFSTQAGSAGEGRMSVWYYRQTGAAPGNPTFGGPASESYAGRIWAFRGVTTSGNPYDVVGSNTAVTVATTTFAGSNLSSTVPDAMVVHVSASMDNNTWGPGSGACTAPTTANASFYSANGAGTDNSVSLCYNSTPLSSAGSLGIPVNTQATLGADAGRYFTFALKPQSTSIAPAGMGGIGGGLTGGAGATASTSVGGGAGTQSAGGAIGGGNATIGSAFAGGSGSDGTGGGAGGAGGTNGGGAGGTGASTTLAAGGGGAGAGYYGGGGGNSASGQYLSGAGGGGGSSYIVSGATATSTASGSSTQAGNNVDGDYSAGVGVGGTGGATSTNGSNGAAGRVVITWSTAAAAGTWSIPNVAAFAGDVVTVFMTGATGSAETVGVTKYDGVGDITGMQLSKRHVTIGSNDAPTVTNANLALYTNSDTEDVFYSTSAGNVINLCAESSCSDARLRVLAGSTYAPGANTSVINFENSGIFAPATSTFRISNEWRQMGTFTTGLSTVIFTATSSSFTPVNATSTFDFYNLTFGESSSTAVWTITKPLILTGSLTLAQGTLARGTTTISVDQNLIVSAGGNITGLATTTFTGSGSYLWTDTSPLGTNIGHAVIDGTARTVTLGGNVTAQSVTIGADDTLNASGSGFNINVLAAWTNNNAFIPQSGTVTFTGTSTGVINRGASSFNNLTFTGAGSNWSFSTTTLALSGNLTIATGTVTLPTGTTTIGGSFLNTGGTFLHNNGEVRMTSTAAGKTITQRAGTFLNAFYDLVFTGSGSWSFSEAAATTTHNFNIQAGTVTLASSTLTVGGDFSVTGSGAFAHNNGELILLVQESSNLRLNGSSLNNLRTRGNVSSWYNNSWTNRKPLTVNSSQVPADQTNFPIFVNLNNLGSTFFSAVKSDGSDIRVTTSDGVTEVPFELVAINTGSQSGELHFKAPTVSSSTNTTFYIYYGNAAATAYASTSTYGARNVWTNGYAAVYHLNQDPTGTGAIMLDSTANALHGTRVGTAASGRLVTAKVGNGLDMVGTSGDYTIDFPAPGIGATSSYTFSAWFNNGTISSGLNNDGAGTYMFDRPSASNDLAGLKVIGGNYAHQFRYGDSSGIGSVNGAAATTGVWQNVVWGRTYNSNRFIYVNKAGVTTTDSAAALTPPAPRLGGHQTNTIYDGIADEFRISNVARSSGWISAEYNNQASTSAFYTVSAAQSRSVRIFTDTNATILGNVVIENGGDCTFPTGTLSIAGSFTNLGLFTSNNGTVRFAATSGAKTIAAGSSTFATVDFNSATGDFTVTQNATATVALLLTTVGQFTLQSGKIFEVSGSFTNAANGASTTWASSTLRLSGADSALNVKSHAGDVYGTLETIGDTDVSMWNSSAVTYSTASTSSIYSQDHAGVDGTLNIYGNYLRTTGTEYWSYATDFDGAALTASTSRQVNVRVSTSSVVAFMNASLNLVGSALASTTIDAQTGAFALSASNTTITAQHFRVTGTDSNGFSLMASSTLSTFSDGFFTVVPGRTGITIASTTVTKNPSAQFFRVGFATSSAGAASNVTMVGTSSAFVWFRSGGGNLYGEAYDANDANPGSIRFDDSSNVISISGVVYADDGVTPLGAPTCNGTTPNVRVVINGGTFTASTTCAVGTGAFTFASVNYIGDPKAIIYLDTNGGVSGSVVTKTLTSNISNLHIYANRVMTRHEDTLPLTIADMTLYDFTKDTDIKFVATTTGSTTLKVMPGIGLNVFSSSTFTPGGNVTLLGNASSTSYEGTLQIGANATFTATGTETHTLAGRLVLATTSTLSAASSTFVFNATTTGKSITSPNTITFNHLQFTGVGGGWNITAPLSVLGNMDVATGTVTGTNNITLATGSLSGNGVLSLGSGTTTLQSSNTLGGTSAWTFANLVLGSGSIVGTTTPVSSATTTISGRLTISNAHVLNAGATKWDLSGAGTVLVETGTLAEGTSRIRYSGAGATVTGTGYYDLDINSGAGSQTYTAAGAGIAVQNNLIIGGTATSTFDVNTNDPTVTVGGSLSIRTSGVLGASNSSGLSVAGSWTNAGTFTHNSGTVTFTSAGAATIIAGNSSFATAVVNGTGSFVLSGNATATTAFTLTNHGSFTLSTSSVLALGGTFTNGVGGAATTWASSTVYFYTAGTKTINASTTADVYGTINVASGTNVRMWNSSASVYSGAGGIYSQNHSGVSGNLNIYGAFTLTSGSEYWNYATDFDGTTLSGAGRRAVTVSFASSSSFVATGGSLQVLGTSTASTTLQNQGVGTYSLLLSGTTATEWNYATIRDINASGVVFSGTPTVTDFSHTDHLVKINGGSGITVGGTVIDANQAKNFTGNVFATSSPATTASNVTATGTSVSSWRFTNHLGALSGEAFDTDPAGDPGYLVWADSAALITVSGHVYSDEGSTVSTVCNGVTPSILLRVAGLTTYTTSCAAGTGAYSIPGVSFSANDTLTLYIDNSAKKAANVTTEPVSSISNMDLYENRVIVRHEGTNPMTIAKMAVWDSSDDGDILFTAVDAGTDTLSLAADQKLLIWNGKTFEPNGDVTVSGGGAGGAQDGTLEAQTNATFRAKGTETHTVGGSFVFNTGATFTAAQSTTTFTTTGAARSVNTNGGSFYNVAFAGAGSWTVATATFTTMRSYTQSNGTVTFGSGTTTIGASFNVTGGTFSMPTSGLVFVSTTTSNVVRLNNVSVPGLRFTGVAGAWTLADTNATTTGAFTVTAGTVTLPSGNLAVGRNFENLGGTITHNNAKLIMTATSSANLGASSSSLYSVKFTGVGPFTMTDVNLTLLDSLTLATGTLTLATGTLSVGGDFLIATGTVNHASGTVLLNASVTGKVVAFGNNALYNVVFGSGTGGWTLFGNATTTNNFSLTGASVFVKEPNTTLNVGGVFTNTVGGTNTTWATSTLRLYGTSGYTINTKTTGGDVYGTLSIAAGLPLRSWNSSAATTTVAAGASLYSQDHSAVDGSLYIFGNFTIATTSEYWSYATDFDGTALGGSSRAVSVRMAQNATTTVNSGALSIVGALGATTSIARQATGTYAFKVQGGTFNAQYYSFAHLDTNGLNFVATPVISDLSNGYFDLAVASGSLITVPAATLDANASKIFTSVGFNATGPLTGYNVQLVGSTTNAWRFTSSYGNIGTESFDIDGLTTCGSIRFDSSGCLLTTQANFRWRNDDGGEGVPTSEWYDTGFTYRTQVRVANPDGTTYANSAVKLTVPYDASMQSDFDDLRFTSSDGVTAIPYWIERYTASTDAVVWVKVPVLQANAAASVLMYYGSSTVASTGSSTATFSAVDDFEDNNITEYSGDTSFFAVDTAPVYGGSRALEASSGNKSGVTTNGLYRTAMSVSQGQVLRWMQYIDTVTGSADEGCTLFGVQTPGTSHNNYAVCLELFGTDRMVISKNVTSDSQSGTILGSTTASYTTGWYQVEVDWQTNNRIDAYLRNSAGTLVATSSITDSSYTTGGVGFSFWVQNGSWDDFTARPKAMLNPTIYFGAKQTYGGATWLAAQNAAGGGAPGDIKRLRVGIENTGLDVTSQVYRLEYASKGAAPSCEAVSAGSYSAVPNQASCGSSAICMQTSSNVTDGNVTTDLLATSTGQFTAGRFVESPSNAAASMNLNQSNYTELEYVITPTVNASSSYCFRVTNGGTALDYYAEVAEWSLRFDPTFGVVTLNSGTSIALTPGATTTVYATGTVTDLNGYADITNATATIYRSGVGPSCTANNSNCYKAGTNAGSSSCSLTNCAGNTCELRCAVDMYFFADPTDAGTYSGQNWEAYLEVNDQSGGYDFASAIGQELFTLRALTVDSAINYGSLAVSADTGATNASTSISNLGNVVFNIDINGTDLTGASGASTIPAAQQKFATSTFTYSACVTCSALSSTTPTTLPINLSKAAVPSPLPTTSVYWGIAIPIGTRSTSHSGTNIFTPV